MFSNLRINSQIYLLHKDNVTLDVGTVTNITQPVPKFPVTNFINPQEYVVDLTIKVKDSDITLQKLPANLDIADQGINGNLVITTSKEAMNAEIESLKQRSVNIINSIDCHKNIIQECDKLLQELNPEYAEQRLQKQEIDNLKTQMSEMMSSMKELMIQMKTKVNN